MICAVWLRRSHGAWVISGGRGEILWERKSGFISVERAIEQLEAYDRVGEMYRKLNFMIEQLF